MFRVVAVKLDFRYRTLGINDSNYFIASEKFMTTTGEMELKSKI